MKKGFWRVMALILAVAIFLPVLGVFAYASEGEETENESTLRHIMYRSYDEGWDVDNGASFNRKNQKFEIDREETEDFGYNYFHRLTKVEGGADGHFQFDFGSTPLTGGAVVEFDLKVDSICSIGSIGYFLTASAAADRDYYDIGFIEGGDLYLVSKSFKVGALEADWYHLAYVFNFDQSLRYCRHCGDTYYVDGTEEAKCSSGHDTMQYRGIQIRTYFSKSDVFDWKNAVNSSNVPNGNYNLDNSTYYYDLIAPIIRNTSLPATIHTFRMGFSSNLANTETNGQSFCLDNFAVYYDPSPKDEDGNIVPMTIIDDISDTEKYGYGKNVNENASKVINIETVGENKKGALENSIIMKVGSDYLLRNTTDREMIFKNSDGDAYGAPQKINGVIYVPFEVFTSVTAFPTFVHDDGKTYDISTAGGTASITMGRQTAVINGKRVELSAPPMIIADPDDPENTYAAIAKEDVDKVFQGFYLTYDDMGMMIFSEAKDVLNRSSDLKRMLELMLEFIYDFKDEDEMYNLLKENTNNFDHPYLLADEEQFKFMNDVYEGREDDPLYKSWLDLMVADSNSLFTRFTTAVPRERAANPSYFEKACDVKPDKYKYLAFEITNSFSGIKEGKVYADNPTYTYAKGPDENGYYYQSKVGDKDNGSHFNGGYDYDGGRNSEHVYYSSVLAHLALSYRITNDEKFAELGYDIMLSLCDKENWEHWAHGHFLSAAESMSYMCYAYDWFYDIWSEIQHERAEGFDLDYITKTIYERVYYHGYELSVYSTQSDAWRTRQGEFGGSGWGKAWNWSVCEINWNAVCNSGLVLGAMAIAGSIGEIDFSYPEDGVDTVKWCLTNSLERIAKFGLVQYAPDGSYIEGPSYWSYATNYYTMLLAALPGAFGDDLGYYEGWGMDKTYYFAIQTEFEKILDNGAVGYEYWAFNDCTFHGSQDTSAFLQAAEIVGDPALAAIRIKRIQDCGGLNFRDIIGYKKEYKDLDLSHIELALDWEIQNLDGVLARSTWDGAGIFTGVMGNHNNYTQHDQVDSGNFVYASQGYFWIPDLGADHYNIYEYWGNDVRERYYRHSPEGHNTVLITSLQETTMPYGQSIAGGGKVQEIVYAGDAGMYTVIDNRGAYDDITNYARRGLLFTNSRSTVVIQDEIAFRGVQSCAWVVHTEANINLMADGKTAYFSKNIGGRPSFIRLTLISDNPKLKFKQMTCGIDKDDFLMDGAHRDGFSVSKGGIAEMSRKGLKRLVVEADNVLVFNMAVVIEVVDSIGSEKPVQYKYTNINKWQISEKYESKEEVKEEGATILSAKMTDIKTFGEQARKLYESGYALTTRVIDYYKFLTRVNVAVNTYRPETFKNIPQIYTAYEKYLNDLALYNAYRENVNAISKVGNSVGGGLCYGV